MPVQALHRVIVSSIYQVNEHIRLLQLQPVAGEPPIKVGRTFLLAVL
jgi:hypothetical protein